MRGNGQLSNGETNRGISGGRRGNVPMTSVLISTCYSKRNGRGVMLCGNLVMTKCYRGVANGVSQTARSVVA